MKEHNIETIHAGDMAFKTDISGHEITIDAHKEFGGNNLGPSPKKLLLNALTGCTAMDVVSMLNKMRVQFSDFSVSVKGLLTDEHPIYYHTLNITYNIKVDVKDTAKMEKAVSLSVERYCGVSAMLSKAAKISHDINYL